MISHLWSHEIHGSVEHSDASCIITAPRFGDGNWRGGWWARYDHDTGMLRWRHYHRCGACLFAICENMIIATTHKSSGVYAISLESGRQIWSRLGYRFNILLKLFEFLPCDNEGDGPLQIMDGHVLTSSGRLLDRNSGRVLSVHRIEYRTSSPWGIKSVDGKPFNTFHVPRFRYGGMPTQPERSVAIDQTLSGEGLETSGPQWCSQRSGDFHYVIACSPPAEHQGSPQSRLYQPAEPVDVPHYLLIMRHSDKQVVHREELGHYYQAEIGWFDSDTLALTMQTKRQWNWGYRRDARIYCVSRSQNAC